MYSSGDVACMSRTYVRTPCSCVHVCSLPLFTLVFFYVIFTKVYTYKRLRVQFSIKTLRKVIENCANRNETVRKEHLCYEYIDYVRNLENKICHTKFTSWINFSFYNDEYTIEID